VSHFQEKKGLLVATVSYGVGTDAQHISDQCIGAEGIFAPTLVLSIR
jgi:hypothetical protein